MMVDIQKYYAQLVSVVLTIASKLDGTGANFVVFDAEEDEVSSASTADPVQRSLCPFCSNKGHGAKECFKLLDPKYLNAHLDRLHALPSYTNYSLYSKDSATKIRVRSERSETPGTGQGCSPPSH